MSKDSEKDTEQEIVDLEKELVEDDTKYESKETHDKAEVEQYWD